MECHELHSESVQAHMIRWMHRYSSMGFAEFQKLGIHPGQFPVLLNVATHEGINQKELARRLHIKPPTVTVTVNRLEKVGLLTKDASEEDRRVIRLRLTEKGKAVFEKLDLLFREQETKMMRGFTEEEKQLLLQMLERMTENIREKEMDHE